MIPENPYKIRNPSTGETWQEGFDAAIKWLDGSCTEHYDDFLDSINFSQERLEAYEAEYHARPTLLRCNCPQCWKELKGEK